MAIKKNIVAQNGVPLEYHRIVFLQKITNKCNLIQVASYPSEGARNVEIEAQNEETEIDVYCVKNVLRTEYNEEMTIQEAYEYLKETEPFDGAVDC